jgi:hypothetical protein
MAQRQEGDTHVTTDLEEMSRATATSRPRIGTDRTVWVSHLITALVAAAAIVTATRLLALPSVVDRITVENPTRSNLTISVTDEDRDGWMTIGIAPPEATSTFDQIIDHGHTWIFRFSADGVGDVELQLTRQQLDDGQWRLSVPATLREG